MMCRDIDLLQVHQLNKIFIYFLIYHYLCMMLDHFFKSSSCIILFLNDTIWLQFQFIQFIRGQFSFIMVVFGSTCVHLNYSTEYPCYLPTTRVSSNSVHQHMYSSDISSNSIHKHMYLLFFVFFCITHLFAFSIYLGVSGMLNVHRGRKKIY